MARFLTVNEVASLLKKHPDTVRIWVREGKLQGFQAGRTIVISEEQLQDFLKPTGAAR